METLFRKPGRERPVFGRAFHILILLLLLLLLELLTRKVLFHQSKDFVRFASYAERADTLAEHAGLRIALIGNSAVEEGVDLELLRRTLERNGIGRVSIDAFLADGSEINTWRFMANHYFLKRRSEPDIIIITFFDNILQDSASIDLGRLAQFFTDMSDWSDLFQVELQTAEQRIEFMASSAWATYAARDRIRQRVLSLAIPDYRGYESVLNESNKKYALSGKESAVHKNKSYRAFERFFRRAREHGVSVCVVAFPTKGPLYQIEPEVLRIIEANGADYLDMREHLQLKPNQYRDAVHLNASGKAEYTVRLGGQLIPLLRKVVIARSQNGIGDKRIRAQYPRLLRAAADREEDQENIRQQGVLRVPPPVPNLF